MRHHLDEMVALVPDANPLKPGLRALEHLGTYATSFRYTTPTGRIPDDPPTQEIEATAKNIEAALNEAARRFGVDLAAVDAPAANKSPIR